MLVIVLLSAAGIPAPSGAIEPTASRAEGEADNGVVCPPIPQALLDRRAATGRLPPPSSDDLALYHAYMDYLRANDWGNLCRYREANRLLAEQPRPRVVFLGDSITENWQVRDPELFGTGIIDRGIGGQTTPQMVLRFYQDVVALRPRVVHILAGTNDLAGNTGATGDTQFRNNIRAMVDLAQANGIAVVLGAIPPVTDFPWRPDIDPRARILAWNHWLRSFSDERQIVFVDYHAALINADGGMTPAFATDGVHPSLAGYQRMDLLFQRALKEAERHDTRARHEAPR